MTSKALTNALLVAGGIAAASAIWAGAMLLPPAASTPQAAPAAYERTEALTLRASSAPPAFGVLPLAMTPAAPARKSMLDSAGNMPLPSTSLATAPLQSIGATFSGAIANAALPELGGAAALDGPADAGLDEPVVHAELPKPSVAPPKGKIIVIDASEGTKLDPLRQRNWDLNSVQAIPPMVATPKR